MLTSIFPCWRHVLVEKFHNGIFTERLGNQLDDLGPALSYRWGNNARDPVTRTMVVIDLDPEYAWSRSVGVFLVVSITT